MKNCLWLNWGRAPGETEKVVMWWPLCHISKLGGVCIYMLYFPCSSCALHQVKDILGWGRAGSPLCVQQVLPAHPDLCLTCPCWADVLQELWWSLRAAAQPVTQHITNDMLCCRAVQNRAWCSGSRTSYAVGAALVLVPVWCCRQAENHHAQTFV